MADFHYTFHISIANRKNVIAEITDPANRQLGNPGGRFGYFRVRRVRERIQALHQRAAERQLSEAETKELGELLFDALFDDELRRDFFNFYEQARNKGDLMRVELDVDERMLPEVAALPWEFLRVPTSAGYGTVWLSTAPNLVFSRYRAIWRSPQPIQLEVGERLRIALAVASPDEEGLGEVKYNEIWNALQELSRIQSERIELLNLVERSTTRTIDALLEQKPHIFHFIGHGRLKDVAQRDTGQIALVETVLGGADWINADRFSELFTRHRPGVVLLQACEGAMRSTTEAFTGVASQVVQQKIPVIVAMQYEVSNFTAQQFALEFYQRLARNDSVDKAAQEGRRQIALSSLGYTGADFATPVLFMSVRNGNLFQQSINGAPLMLHEHTGQKVPFRETAEITDTAGSVEIKDASHSDVVEEGFTAGGESAMLRLEELLEAKLLEDFVNRKVELDLFLEQARAMAPDKPILYFYGVGGVGKTTVLKKIKNSCQALGYKIGMADSRVNKSVIDVLQKFRKDLNGTSFSQFDKTVKRYDDINRHANSMINQATEVAGSDSPEAMPIPRVTTAITTINEQTVLERLKQSLGEREVEFYTQAPTIATNHFINALKRMSQQQKIILLFDTFEEVSDAVDEWLTNEFLRGDIGANVRLVLTGRGNLSNKWDDWQRLTATKEIRALSKDQVKEFLDKQGVIEPEVVNGMMSASEGLPWALSLLADWYRNGLAQDDEINPAQFKMLIQQKVVDRFLKQIQDERLLKVVNVISITRRFNIDIISFLIAEKQEVVERLLSALKHYTLLQRRVDGSFSLHDIIRDFLELDLRDRSPDTWKYLHKRAYDYYVIKQKNVDTWNEKQIYPREMLHHQLVLNERDGMNLFHTIFAQVWNIYRLDLCDVFLAELESHKLSREGRSWASYYRGRLAHLNSNDIKAREVFEEILADVIEDRKLKASVLLSLGKVLYHGSEFDYAEQLIQESVSLEDEDTIGDALDYLGKIHVAIGKYEKASQEFSQAKEAFERKKDTYNLAWTHYSAGALAVSLQDPEAARQEYEESLKLFSQLGHISGQVLSYLRLGECFLLLGNTKRAEQLLLRSKALLNKLDDRYIRMMLLTALGDLNRQKKQINEAKENYFAALEIVSSYRASAKEVLILRGLCELSLDNDDFSDLRRYADQGLQLGLERGHWDAAGWFYLYKGHILLRRLLTGEFGQAMKPADEYFRAIQAAQQYSKYVVMEIARHLTRTIQGWFVEKQADVLIQVMEELLLSLTTRLTLTKESEAYQFIQSQLEEMRKGYLTAPPSEP